MNGTRSTGCPVNVRTNLSRVFIRFSFPEAPEARATAPLWSSSLVTMVEFSLHRNSGVVAWSASTG